MTDLLVKLYTLDDTIANLAHLRQQGVLIRRAMAYESSVITAWIGRSFHKNWAAEVQASFVRQPVSCFIACTATELVGFAAYEVTMRNYFGPCGVAAECRNRGIGSALAVSCFLAMREMGYAYAIIGGAHQQAPYYTRKFNAIPIVDSVPGIYPSAVTKTL